VMINENSYRFLDTVNQISMSGSLERLNELSIDICKSYDLANIVYHALYVPGSASFNPILIPTYDPEWVRKYINNDYFKIDPVVNSGKRGFLPLDWSTLDRETNGARNFFVEADRYGVGRQGVTMPIRGPGGERALFTITSNLPETEWKKYRPTYIREFQIIAHYFHDRAVQLCGHRVTVGLPSLSPREMECLQLTADGLAPKRVAGRLKISDSAVRLYLRSACRKLGCASIHQAVAKMVTLELIYPRL
jgi:DNA-binding CsgD family transcriptional regulator